MKKLFFIAAIASAALVSCTKNEVAQVADQDQITFATPVVGNLTKVAGEIGTNYDKNEKFVVYGWYCEEDSFDPATASVYMNGVTVKHNGDINATVDAGDQGAWEPVTTFYWPKNGKLTFSAYSPVDEDRTEELWNDWTNSYATAAQAPAVRSSRSSKGAGSPWMV